MRSLTELEILEAKLFNCFASMPNGKERQKIYEKWKAVYDEITARAVRVSAQP